MKPEIKALLERDLIRAYNEAENEIEAENLYWLAFDIGIKLPKLDPETEAIKRDIWDTVEKIINLK